MTSSGPAPERSLPSRVAHALTASLGLGEVLAAVTRAAVDLVPDSFALIWLVRGDRLTLRAAAGSLEQAHSAIALDLALGEGLIGRVALAREVMRLDEPADDPRAARSQLLR